MLLFSMINLNVSGVFVYLSYSPLFFMYFVMSLFMYFGLSMWSFVFDMNSVMLMVFILVSALFFLFTDVMTDNLYGLTDVTTLYSTVQYCFIWFMLSEAALFLSFFWGAFALNLMVTMEFHSLVSVMPTMYSFNIANFGFMFYWFYLDLFNMVMNTFFLFFSGMFCNYFYLFIYYKSLYGSMIFCFLSLVMGFLFVWNQLWEFALLTFTVSTNSFCSTLFAMDLLHFSHVSLGMFFMFLSSIKLLNNQVSNMKIVYFTCIILYWHFVDLVWFILLSFMYFGMMCAMFLM